MRLMLKKPTLLTVPQVRNQIWTMNFVYNQSDDRRNSYINREALGTEVGITPHSQQLIRALNQTIGWDGQPEVMP